MLYVCYNFLLCGTYVCMYIEKEPEESLEKGNIVGDHHIYRAASVDSKNTELFFLFHLDTFTFTSLICLFATIDNNRSF